MNEPICPHCGGGPSDEQHQRECEEDTVLYQQQARIADLERQLAEAQEPSDLLLRGLKRQYDGELTPIEAVGFALGRIGALGRQLEAVQRAAENYAGQDGREALFDAGMIAAGEGILAILGEKGA